MKSLRTKIFLALILTLCVVVGLFYYFSKRLIIREFERLETVEAAGAMERVQNIMDQELEAILSTGIDWGFWTETYDFVSSGDEAYIRENLDDQTVLNLGMNLLLYVNTRGELVHGKAMDLERAISTDLPWPLVVSLLNQSPLFKQNARGELISGLLLHPGTPPLLVAWVPILKGDRQGPSRGSLILGKYLTESFLGQISRMAKVDLFPETMDEGSYPNRKESEPGAPQDPGHILVEAASPEVIRGTLFLDDLNGNPALALNAEIPREISRMGRSALLRFLLLVIAMTLAVSLVVWIILEKMILSRLYNIIDQITGIRKTKNSAVPVTISGNDELSLLARSINGMLAAIHESNILYQSLIESTPLPIVAADTGGRITEWNPAAQKTFGWSRDEVLGRHFPFISKDQSDPFDEFRENLITSSRIPPFEAPGIRKDKTPIELSIYPSRLISFDGLISGSILVMTDITKIKNRNRQLRRNLSEKEMLLREVHHRIKNNLQAISSILEIQKIHLDNPQMTEVFQESQNRIHSMAIIHEELYRSADTDTDHSRSGLLVNTRNYISRLIDQIFLCYNVDRTKILLELQVDNFYLDIDIAIPCALIINELISNSLKYAFDGRDRGRIQVVLKREGDSCRLRISDDGTGLPEKFSLEKSGSLGLILVRSLAEQLGTMKVSREGGAIFVFEFRISVSETVASRT